MAEITISYHLDFFDSDEDIRDYISVNLPDLELVGTGAGFGRRDLEYEIQEPFGIKIIEAILSRYDPEIEFSVYVHSDS